MLDVSPFSNNYVYDFDLFSSYRPGQAAMLVLQYLVTGESGSARLVLATGLAALESFLLYLVSRQLGLRPLVAGATAGLMAIGTFVDSTRLWSTPQTEMSAAVMFLGGLACALAGLRSSGGRRRIAWHGGAIVLYLASIFTYESFLVLLPLCGLGYLLIAPRRPALQSWAADLLTLVVAAATAGRIADEQRGGEVTISHLLQRVDDVIPGASRVFGWSIPGETFLPAAFGILVVAVAGLGVVLALRRDGPLREPARQWLALAAVGVIGAGVGLITLLSAEDALTPGNAGFANRLLATSSLFYPLLYVSLAVLFAIGIAALIRRPGLSVPLAALGVLLVGVQMVGRELQRQDDFSAAWKEEQRIIHSVQRTLPSPEANSVIVSFRHPIVLDGGLVSFDTDYDLDGALKLRYGDPTIRAHPYVPGASCGPEGMSFSGLFEPASTLPYGQMYFVDVARRTAVRISDQARCTAEVQRLTAPGRASARAPGR
jgi:hypothetical protein